MDNIKSSVSDKNVRFVKGSISNLRLLNKEFRDATYIFHQAAITSVQRSINDPLTTNRVNATGTLNVLVAARNSRVKRVVYASSCAVYGDSHALPKREDMLPDPLSPYAVSKLTGEYYSQVFEDIFHLSTVSLRYFNVYGPRHDPNSEYAAVIPRFIASALESKPLTIFGDGEQTRDFVFVKDVVKANILAAESDTTGVFNIGRGESISINRLAELILRLVGKANTAVHKDPMPGDIRHSLSDISRARGFGYQPEYSLEDGLLETLRSFRLEF